LEKRERDFGGERDAWEGGRRLAAGFSRERNLQHLIKKARQFCPPVLWTRGKCSVDDFSRRLYDKIGEPARKIINRFIFSLRKN